VRSLRAAAAAFHGLALLAFASARDQRGAWLLLLPTALALFLGLEVAPRLVARLRELVLGLAAAIVLYGLFWTIYPVLPPALGLVAILGGWALGLLGALALAIRELPWGRVALPATLGVLLAAALEPDRSLRPHLLAGFVLLAVMLVIAAEPGGGPLRLLRRAGRATLLLLPAAALAVGIARLLPWAQPLVEQAAANALTPQAGEAGPSDTSQLGEIEQISLGHGVVARVWTAEPRRLRRAVFLDFDGQAWRAEHATPRAVQPGPVPEPPGLGFSVGELRGHPVRAEVLLIKPASGPLPVPAGLARLYAETDAIQVDGHGLVQVGGGVERYRVLAGDPSWPEPGPVERSLALPATVDPRVRELASRLAQGATPRERVQRTLQLLWRDYRYSLRVGRFRTRDPVAEFLLEKHEGYCEYFASAASLLLRLQGVPTRYVTGFQVRDESIHAGHHVVRQSDAHAWIDAWLDGRWEEYDPTPAAQFAEVHREPGGLGALWDAFAAAWAELLAGPRAGLLRAAGAALVAVALLAALLLRRRPASARAVPLAVETTPSQVADLLRRVDVLLSARGHRRPPSRAPLEHLLACPERALDADLRLACREAIDCYYGVRFGGAAVDAGLISGLARRLSAPPP
jgi:transglutaminase-like putative cysteine protease